MKRVIWSVPALVVFFVSVCGAVEINRVVIRVNDRISTLFDYQTERAKRIRAIQRSSADPRAKQEMLASVGEDTLRDLFDDLLLLSRADQLGVAISDLDVDAAVERAKESVGIETEEDFQAGLRQSGFTLEEFRQNLRRNEMMRQVMAQDVQPRIRLSEEDLRRYYRAHSEEFEVPERLSLREVVVLESSGASAQEMARIAGEIQEGLAAGKSLEEAVERFVDEGLTGQPIDLGWVEAGDLDRTLEEAAWALEVGEFSRPIAARGGLHLVELVDRQEAQLRPFSEVRSEIEAKESERRLQEELDTYFHELEAKSFVQVIPPPEAAGFRTRTESSPRLGALPGVDDLAPAPRPSSSTTGGDEISPAQNDAEPPH